VVWVCHCWVSEVDGFGGWKLEFGSWRVGSWKLGSGSQEVEV
jgi:hypothetical protein